MYGAYFKCFLWKDSLCDKLFSYLIRNRKWIWTSCGISSVITETNIFHQHQGWQYQSCSSFEEQLCQCGTALPPGLEEQFDSLHYPFGLVCLRRVPSSDAFWSGTDLPSLAVLEQQRPCVCELLTSSYQASLRLMFPRARLSVFWLGPII